MQCTGNSGCYSPGKASSHSTVLPFFFSVREILFFTLCCPNGTFFPWEIRVAFPKEMNYNVHAGSFRVPAIHRTLTWTTWSLTCARHRSYAAYSHSGLAGHTDSESAQHFWLGEKLSQIFPVLLTGFEPLTFGSRVRRCPTNWATPPRPVTSPVLTKNLKETKSERKAQPENDDTATNNNKRGSWRALIPPDTQRSNPGHRKRKPVHSLQRWAEITADQAEIQVQALITARGQSARLRLSLPSTDNLKLAANPLLVEKRFEQLFPFLSRPLRLIGRKNKSQLSLFSVYFLLRVVLLLLLLSLSLLFSNFPSFCFFDPTSPQPLGLSSL